MNDEISKELIEIFLELGTMHPFSSEFNKRKGEIDRVIDKDNYSKEEVRELLKHALFIMSSIYIETGNIAQIKASDEEPMDFYREINVNAHRKLVPKSGGDGKRANSNIHKGKVYWDEWQKDPNLYKSKTAFKKHMADLGYVSERQAANWIKGWEEEERERALEEERLARQAKQFQDLKSSFLHLIDVIKPMFETKEPTKNHKEYPHQEQE